MSPSPIRAENQRMVNPRQASNSATAATGYGKPDHDRLVAGQDAVVDDVPEQHRVDHRDERVEDGGDQEEGSYNLYGLA